MIKEILQSIGGFQYATSLDYNMGYMALKLCPRSRKILHIIMPFGLFECLVLPQGVKPATDIFQARIMALFTPMWDLTP